MIPRRPLFVRLAAHQDLQCRPRRSRGLAEYDEMEGIGWKWQSVDGAMGKTPLRKNV